jgi:hypothetical protein
MVKELISILFVRKMMSGIRQCKWGEGREFLSF